MKHLILGGALLLQGLWLHAQGSGIPIESPTNHILDRLEILSGKLPPFHATMKPIWRGDAVRFAQIIDTTRMPLSALDRFDLYYIFKDNNEWLAQPTLPTTIGGQRQAPLPENYEYIEGGGALPLGQAQASYEDRRYVLTEKPLLKHFYKSPANFFEINERYFHLRVNPVVQFKLGKTAQQSGLDFLNQRGLALRGSVDDRIYFHTRILETQARWPPYVNDYIELYQAVPGAGFFKDFESSVFDIENGFDYLQAEAYLGFNLTSHVGIQFGHGRNFIGSGYRSMLLSDFAHNYFYLKLNWKVWRFHYQNLFAELAAESRSGRRGTSLAPKKYMAAHFLSYRVTPNFTFGFFEATIFSRERNGGQFELQYLNPVILYRAVEQFIGSPDNVLLGIDLKWNFLRRFQWYGQLLFDEFVFRELVLDNRGWWANKFAVQAGLKYINAFGIDHLDLQAEFNTARPYTYTHRDSLGSSYSHFNQPLAHPLGANFREFILLARWQPHKRWWVHLRFLHSIFGEDHNGSNYGGNILLSSRTREQDYDNRIGQGIRARTALLGADISYSPWHNLFLELNFLYRRKNSELDSFDDTATYIGGGLRFNIGPLRHDF